MMKKTITTLVVLLCAPTIAVAQDFSMPIPANSAISDALFSSQINNAVRRPQPQPTQPPRGEAVRQEQSGQAAVRSNAAASLTFATSLVRRQANVSAFVDQMSVSNPAAGGIMRQAFAQSDPLAQLETIVRPAFGANMNNLADAYAMWLSSNWAAATGYDGNLTRAQFQAVRGQMADKLLQMDMLRTMTDADKQQMAEQLFLNALMVEVGIERYKSDPAQRAQFAQGVAASSKAMGFDLEAIILTETGFVPR